MKEQNHQANKINSARAEDEANHTVNTSPTAFSKYAFVIFIALLLTFFIGAYFYWKYG